MATRARSCRTLATHPRRYLFGVISMVKVSGLANPSDMLTKHLQKDIFRKYAANLYNAAIADV